MNDCNVMQDTVNQAGLMFLPMETASAMVQAEAARVDTTSSALLFGSLPGSDLPFPQELQVGLAMHTHSSAFSDRALHHLQLETCLWLVK